MSELPSHDYDADFDTQTQPTAWVRAAMLTRCNSIIRGHSAVRQDVAETILALLRHDITPIVPLRGSISASGDLSPLSYIAGAIEGNPDIFVRCGRGADKVMSAQEALEQAKIQPVILRAKEGLGLLNGTAFSAGTASLALDQAQDMTIISQVLTSMSVEALTGTAESFWPKIAAMRPHPGQIECAANILAFLDGSKLAKCVERPKDTKVTGLFQDRYAVRTAPQWIGPQIEDFVHATNQIRRELNSTTDNPLIDTEDDHILHGGNFQAAVITSTMDRTRLCLERLGRMLFAQATEIINPMLNNGLPANLASDEPSLSFTCKGVDINMASYASELGFLANPVGNHVMSAEMHNQAINSIALISCRHTFQALDVLRIMSSAYLFVLCQALDLRVLQIESLKASEVEVQGSIFEHFGALGRGQCDALDASVWSKILATWPTTTTLDLSGRCAKTADAVIEDVVKYLSRSDTATMGVSEIVTFSAALKRALESVYNNTRNEMYAKYLNITPEYLGKASHRMYRFVRQELGVRFHRGLIEHPTQPAEGKMDAGKAAERKTIGSQISIIYEALKSGQLTDTLMDIVEESMKTRPENVTT